MVPKVLFFTNVFPHYRKSLWQHLIDEPSFDIHFYFSPKDHRGIKTTDFRKFFKAEQLQKLHFIKNYYLSKSLILWQSKVVLRCLFARYKVAIFTGESHVFSTWIGSILAKLRGKTVLFWGHGQYGDEKGLKKLFRRVFNRLADHHLVYENRAKELMIKTRLVEENISVIYNSLDYELQAELFNNYIEINKEEVLHFFKKKSIPTLIFSGRFTREKKLNQLINVVNTLNAQTISFNLLLIGSGDQKVLEELQQLSSEGIDKEYIHFYGSCYEEEKLARLFMTSDLCVSPGNIGLLAIHSLSYGTPVCTHDQFSKQMPEVEAITDGENGVIFKYNDEKDLERKISEFDFEKINRRNNRSVVDQYYNPKVQLEVIKKVINKSE